jgi:hypothetical protein
MIYIFKKKKNNQKFNFANKKIIGHFTFKLKKNNKFKFREIRNVKCIIFTFFFNFLFSLS